MKKRLETLAQWADDNLQKCIMKFWSNDFLLDNENGGFYSRITLDMQRDNELPRGLTLSGRIVYAFSAAYCAVGNPLYKERAKYAFEDLVQRFYDKEYGGAFTSVTAQGEILSMEKPIYCEAFFVMACAAYYQATNDAQALKLAKETVVHIEQKAKLAPASYYNNLSRDWKPAEGMGFGTAKNKKAPKFDFPEGSVMFAHHLCQAYVQMYVATKDEKVQLALQQMVAFVIEKLYDASTKSFKTIVGADGSRVGNHQSFGHDCEISYLVLEAAKLVGTKEQIEAIKLICIEVLTNARENDFDAYGSLYNGADLVEGIQEKSHVWWAQAEAVTAMLCGYELTGDETFLLACEKQAAYIQENFVNEKDGDWYNNVLVDENGKQIVDGMHGFDKLNGGKCPFHNTQMCIEVMKRCNCLIKGES